LHKEGFFYTRKINEFTILKIIAVIKIHQATVYGFALLDMCYFSHPRQSSGNYAPKC